MGADSRKTCILVSSGFFVGCNRVTMISLVKGTMVRATTETNLRQTVQQVMHLLHAKDVD